jgi:hypothetical protein
LNECYYKELSSTCVTSCGNYHLVSGGVCLPNECSTVTPAGENTCKQVPNCYYKELSSTCVTSCGDFYSMSEGMCLPDECSTLPGEAGKCIHVPDCYYKEVSNIGSCVSDCGVKYDSDNNFGLCILKENPYPNSENQLFPSYLLYIIIGVVLLIIIIIVISLIVFKVRSKKDSSQFIFFIFLYLYLF